MSNLEYEIKRKITASDVPSWVRRESKWDDLIQEIELLAPGEALEVAFDTTAVANRARNAVRDLMNARLELAEIRTRLIPAEKSEDKKSHVFFTRLPEDQIFETD
jgi:hypothetical protein